MADGALQTRRQAGAVAERVECAALIFALVCACSDPVRGADAGRNITNARICAGGDSRNRTYYHDADGDGFGVAGSDVMHGCVGETPDGYAPNANDCDDTNSNKQLERYRDRDHDGYGDSAELVCASATDPEYADRGDDCDDGSAARSPGATEVWLDGLDQNCDGTDELRGCIAAPGKPREAYAASSVISFPDLTSVEVKRDVNCAGADLYFVLLGACPVCGGGRSTVVIGNRGTSAAAFRVESNAQRFDVEVPLQPQQLSQPFELRLNSPASDVQISVLDNAVDCELGNNVRNLSVGFTDCAAP